MEPLQLAFTLVGLVALGTTLVDYFRSLANLGDESAKSAFVSQTIAFFVFVGVVFLAAADDGLFGKIELVGTTTLNSLSIPAKILVGLMLGGTGGFLYGFKQAFDNNDSSKVPPFVK